MALGDFLFSLQEIAVGYEHMSIKTLLYLAETRLGRLRKLSKPEEITNALKISDAELGVVLQRELFSRSEVKPPPEQTVGSKRVAEPIVGIEGGPARQKLKMASRTPPSLAGGQPCWNWILRRRGCEGTICMGKTKKGAATPRPMSSTVRIRAAQSGLIELGSSSTVRRRIDSWQGWVRPRKRMHPRGLRLLRSRVSTLFCVVDGACNAK